MFKMFSWLHFTTSYMLSWTDCGLEKDFLFDLYVWHIACNSYLQGTRKYLECKAT